MKCVSDTISRIRSLIQTREREHIEFKRTVPSPFKMAKEMTAMANTVGGNILIGVDDAGSIVGVDNSTEEKMKVIQAAQYHCSPTLDPQITTVPIDVRVVLWVVIQPAAQRHTAVDQRGRNLVYVRVHDKNLIASKKTAQWLHDGPSLHLTPLHLDRHEKLLLSYLTQQQKITLQEFCRHANLSKRRASRILVKLEKAALIRSHDFDQQPFYTLNPRSIKP